jgi:hypothetical protein
MAYWSNTTGLWAELIDSTNPKYANQIRRGIPDHPADPWLFIQAVRLEDFGFRKPNMRPLAVHFIPLTVSEVEISGVFDLRLRAHQDDLAKYFRTDFSELLSELINPYRGGNLNHDAIARPVRDWGARGLVFPSARRNLTAISTDSHVHYFDGINFVDYRDSELNWSVKRCADGMLSTRAGWRKLGLSLKRYEDDGVRRSWEIGGVEERERLRIQQEIEAFQNLAPAR